MNLYTVLIFIPIIILCFKFYLWVDNIWLSLLCRKVLAVISNGAMTKLWQPVLHWMPITLRLVVTCMKQVTKAMVQRVFLPVSNVAKKGIGRKIALCLHLILLLIQEEGLLHQQVPVTSVVSLGIGQGTALLFRMWMFDRSGKPIYGTVCKSSSLYGGLCSW